MSGGARGLGLRAQHIDEVLREPPQVDYFEAISDNYLGPAATPRRKLAEIARHYPVVLHGVGLNLLGHAPLDRAYLEALCRLADEIDAPFVTDHLCWTGAHGHNHHDLLPAPYTQELLELAAERAHAVQKALDRPLGLENLSSYVEWDASSMGEAEFYRGVVHSAGCHFMLDINNVYVSSTNHKFDAHAYLDQVAGERVLQIHLAGHTVRADGLLLDTHDATVCDEVVALYRAYQATHGPLPTLLEWDASIPPLPDLIAELDRVTGSAR